MGPAKLTSVVIICCFSVSAKLARLGSRVHLYNTWPACQSLTNSSHRLRLSPCPPSAHPLTSLSLSLSLSLSHSLSHTLSLSHSLTLSLSLARSVDEPESLDLQRTNGAPFDKKLEQQQFREQYRLWFREPSLQERVCGQSFVCRLCWKLSGRHFYLLCCHQYAGEC